ncbi:MAG TPA: hypothetical protein VLH08_07180, partial [Acidobacteriota bacterium]|nr:hypothetical protein [Acidobacteriota bacterium]
KGDDFSARFFYDRASDANPTFEPVVQKLLQSGSRPLNEPERLQKALDKAAIHAELIASGLHVPYTIILSPTRDWTKIKIGELIRLGEPFIIKPSIGGGGVGVELNAKTLFDIVKAKESKNKERFLLQEKVLPIQFGDRRAWFRVYYVCGSTISCWWDDYTHIYHRVTPEEETIYGLSRLKTEVKKIAAIAGVQFFSTEIAIVDKETFVVVDYVNDQCDMRLKSRHFDGVPDDVVEEIARCIASHFTRSMSLLTRNLRLTEAPQPDVLRKKDASII